MNDELPHIVVAEPYSPAAIESLRAAGRVTILEDFEAKTLTAAVADCDALLVRSYAQVNRDVLEAATRLRVVGRGGVGLENIDIDAARERGIAVVYTPAAATGAVADLTVGLMIDLIRGMSAGDRAVRTGQFAEARSCNVGRDLSKLTLGIIGLGRIGKVVARRCRRGFGMSVLYNDIVAPGWLDFVAEPVEKEELYARADVVSLHVPLTELTHRLIGEAALARFQPSAVLINTARGAVVERTALARALESGRLAGAALDVFDPEPPAPDDPLLRAPNTLLTPHVAARTVEGLSRMNAVVDDVVRVLTGRLPHYPAWE